MDEIESVGGDQEIKNTAETSGNIPDARLKLVQEWCSRVKQTRDDNSGHKKAFQRMRDDMDFCVHGAKQDWRDSGKYVANIVQRHVRQRVASLYAKNPTALARRRKRRDFQLWDEKPETLIMAQQVIAMATQSGMGAVSPQVQHASAVLQDFQRGALERQLYDGLGETIVILFNYFMDEQDPVFKTQMKQLTRRAVTTGVGYVKLGFQRDLEHSPITDRKIHDHQTRLAEIERILREIGDGDTTAEDAEAEVLRLELKALEQEEMVVVREGLIFDFPASTSIIIDPACSNLNGFVGADWIAHEVMMPVDRVKEVFGIDLKQGDGSSGSNSDFLEYDAMGSEGRAQTGPGGKAVPHVCVWEVYDKKSGMVYVVADGHKDFLTEPASPNISVNGFFPIYALTFNEVESDKELFPPSDVTLLRCQQEEYNRSRDGLREHRAAARPRYASPKGALDDDEKDKLGSQKPFEVVEVAGMDGQSISDILQAVPIPGVDPNLYETNSVLADIQYIVGSQEANLGGISGGTATESSIAEGSRLSSVQSNIDDMDDFLTMIARASGQVLLGEMSPDQVMEIVGAGAVWPQVMPDQIAKEIFLEIEAGSSGRPNSAQEINNLQMLLPHLLQMPGLNPSWLLNVVLKRLDDGLDLTDAVIDGLASIVSQNNQSKAGPGAVSGGVPAAQGGAGADNQEAPPQSGGQNALPLGGGNQDQAGSGIIPI